MSKQESEHVTSVNAPSGDGEALKLPKDVDEAGKYMQGMEQITWTEEEEKRVLRKIDLRILPLLFFTGVFEYLDSQAFGLAALFGMIKDLNLFTIVSIDPLVTSTNKFSWCASIPAFGSVISQYPLLAIIQHLPLGKVAGAIVAYSGFFALMMVVVKNFASTMVVRFFYGFQVVGTPVNLLITPMWWKSSEQPLRIAMWFAGAPVGSLFGQAFDYGVVHIRGQYAASPWRWIYVFVGSFSLVFAAIFLLFFPDSPMKAKFLNDRERQIAIQRLQSNNTGIQAPKFKVEQVWETLKDPQLYLIVIILFSVSFANQAFGTFSGLLLSGFGWPTFQALKMLMPTSGIIIVSMLLSGTIARHYPNHRIILAMLFFLPTIAGNALMWKLTRDNRYGILAGLYLSVTFYGSYIQVLGLLTSNVAGFTKKITFNAIVSSASYAGAIASPFAFKGQEEHHGYPTGISTVLGLICVAELCLLLLWFYYNRENAKKAQFLRDAPPESTQVELAFQDITDLKNPYFVYHF